jgi:hypothetical protein
MSQAQIFQHYQLPFQEGKLLDPTERDTPRPMWATTPTKFHTDLKSVPYEFSVKAPTPQASQQRQPNRHEATQAPPAVGGAGGVHHLNDHFTYLGEQYTREGSGFTNTFLESRDPRHYFDKVYKDFDLYEKSTVSQTIERDVLKGFQEAEPVSIMFFSERNVTHLKGLICKTIAERSQNRFNLTAESQSTSELVIIMRSIYLTNAKQLPDNIQGQVAELNYAVILDLVPRVLKNIYQQLSYIRDHSTQPLTMERPQYLSSAGTRSQRNASVSRTFI